MKLQNTEKDRNGDRLVMFYCPGCEEPHGVRVEGRQPVWEWNGDFNNPTFSPSVRVSFGDKVCHFFIRNGHFEYLTDCFHELKGQVIEIPDWDDW